MRRADDWQVFLRFYLVVFVRWRIYCWPAVYVGVDSVWSTRWPHTSPATVRCRCTRSAWRWTMADLPVLVAPTTDLRHRNTAHFSYTDTRHFTGTQCEQTEWDPLTVFSCYTITYWVLSTDTVVSPSVSLSVCSCALGQNDTFCSESVWTNE